MNKANKTIDTKLVKSVNKNIRSSVRKLKPILKSIVGKKVNIAMRDLSFSEKEFQKILKKLYLQRLQMLKIIINMILTS